MLVKAAVIKDAKKEFTFEEVQLDQLRPDEVLVKMVASGICHSDEAIRNGEVPGFQFPAILGHEGAAVVQEVGSEVKNFKKGDQVLIAYNVCGSCDFCRTGHPSSCLSWGLLNLVGKRPDGTPTVKTKNGTPISSLYTESSFSSYSITNQKNLVKVSKDDDLRVLAPLGCGFLTGSGTVANGLKPRPGESIVIFGTGAVGLGALMMAKIYDCNPIIAVDIHDHRLKTAKKLGATHVVNSKEKDPVEFIKEITNGLGANYSVDTTGISSVMVQSVDCLAPMGIAAPVAVTTHNMDINPFLSLVASNKSIKGVLMGDNVPQIALPELIKFYNEGKFPFDSLIKFYKYEDINKANEDSKSGKVIKPVIIIDSEYRKNKPLI